MTNNPQNNNPSNQQTQNKPATPLDTKKDESKSASTTPANTNAPMAEKKAV